MNERRGPLIAAGVSALVAVLVLVVLVLPRISAVGKRADDLDAAKAQQQALTAQLAQLKEAKREAKIVTKQLNKLETRIPPTAELPSLIRLLQDAATASAVDFVAVAPGTPVSVATIPGISTIPLQVSSGGSFFSVQEFLFKLETLPRAVRVTGINITPASATATTGGTSGSSTSTNPR